jgi:hypothetical protein
LGLLTTHALAALEGCHCGHPSLPIVVTSHIDDVGDSLNDGITSHRSESGIPFVSQLMTWRKAHGQFTNS